MKIMDYGTHHISSINVNEYSKALTAKKRAKTPPPIDHAFVPNSKCFCSSLAPMLVVCKFFGFFPVTWGHVNGRCTYKGSYRWLGYSVFLFFFYFVLLYFATDLVFYRKHKPLPELLTDINDIMYMVFVAILTILNAVRFPRFVETYNKLVPILKEAGLGCPSAFASLRKVEYGYLALFFGLVCVEYGVLIWLHYSESYTTDFSYAIFINTFAQNVPFVFYLLFFVSSSMFIGVLGCFEKLVIDAIKFTPVHPLSDIDETNNRRDFIGLIKYQVCKQDHKCGGKMLLLSQPELIEYLRSLHEDVSLAMYDINGCLNPQLLFHTIVELTVLIVHWYEVIIYTSYTFGTPFASTINILNWIFVIGHTIALFLFLKSAQELKNMVHGLTNFLLEYSTRISSPEEHQQIRIFIEKLEQHRSITASGVFNIDLGIAGPISANILTYVLVALQFDVPKN